MSKKHTKLRINKQIRATDVRLVGDNVEQGVYDIKDALSISVGLELDLVEISPNSNPVVCKVINYNKFVYEQKKRQKEQQKNQKQTQVLIKEIRLSPNIDDHDFQFKLKHAINFLRDNNKVKITIFFRGREIVYKDKGVVVMLKFADSLLDYGVAESMPKLEGKRMSIFIKPKK